ncbi:hypothetical protein [Vibrio phage YC]|uniref:Uncharacterized protein n=1 Tax=Vibrio phage YC TaxID=2267403 RepID=A0A384ZRZ1_9CAUD|nr:hypothetical protein HWB64_gp045 [Vibrio phage YC]AXC34414.1 hypothetical protein [Vibrio phage YC]
MCQPSSTITLHTVASQLLLALGDLNKRMREGLDAQEPYMGAALVMARTVDTAWKQYQPHAKDFVEAANLDCQHLVSAKLVMDRDSGDKSGDLLDKMVSFYRTYALKGFTLVDPSVRSGLAGLTYSLPKAYDEYRQLVKSSYEMRTAIKEGDYEDEVDLDESHGVLASQRQQVENLVESVLSSLDKKVAGRARQAISRAGNKLAALNQFMKSEGIQL